jgi:hypothetical protein
VTRELERNACVGRELPHLSELHKIHYARYPQAAVVPVALIADFDDVVDQLFMDVAKATTLGQTPPP